MKFSRKDVVFVTRDQTGQIVWLETGNRGAGLEHILYYGNRGTGHAQDFIDKCGVGVESIPAFLFEVIQHREVIGNNSVMRHGRMGFSRTYRYGNATLILAGVGENGFIVSAYPI